MLLTELPKLMSRKSIYHTEGPFAGLRPGDVVRVFYKDEAVALMQIDRVKQHALEGTESHFKCKVTIVSQTELRFYGSDDPLRQLVLRNVKLELVKS